MTMLPDGRPGQILAVTILLFLSAMAWIGVVRPLIDLNIERSTALGARLALEDRMMEISQALPKLRENAQTLLAHPAPDQGKLKGATDAIAEANLSMLVEHLAADAGVRVSSVEDAPTEKRGSSHWAGITIRGAGDYRSVIQLLATMAHASDRLLIKGFQLHQAAEGDQHRVLETIMTVYAPCNF